MELREAPRGHRRHREAEGSATRCREVDDSIDVVAADETQLASSSLPLSSRVRV